MQKGPDGIDLSNEIPPRVLFVFEGLLGIPRPDKDRQAKKARRSHRWSMLLDSYEIDVMTARRLHDMAWRRSMRIDCATFEPEGFMPHLVAKFNDMNLAVNNVMHFEDPQDLARQLAYMPEVLWTVHGSTEWQYAFGHTGRLGLIGL